ncbi:hypothetical protein [Collimonas fungivorans]|uniref:hypothetical protein n=1 Tax=Collimonas fungivorans TaxID=158899 RepID=UPI003FA39A8B
MEWTGRFFSKWVRKNEFFLGNQNLRIFSWNFFELGKPPPSYLFLVSILCNFLYENTEFSDDKNIAGIYIETPKNQGEIDYFKVFLFFSGKLESHQTNKAALPGITKHAALQHHAKP